MRLLVVGGHAADFVWRVGGTIGKITMLGGQVKIIALTYGERGESGELWREPGQTVERVKEIRQREADHAARILGADFACWDLGDWPVRVTDEVVGQLADLIRQFQPHIVITHTNIDPFNPDHVETSRAVSTARALATGAGVPSAFEIVAPPTLLHFEPQQPELCAFHPNVLVDITETIERKREAMEAIASQNYLVS
ncbi:MAG: PIG-L deacetylase family protein [Thermomicrobium sp.]|nr:PIG-L deacetylase family protein [Thermomicrobium sp.]